MRSFALALVSLGALSQAAQLPFDFQRPTVQDSLAAESSPAFIGEEQFTTLSHPDFAEHSVRIKKTSGWCEERSDVRSFTGYIDSGARSLFFYYFDSRRDPAKDDLILWTNGGPGCSSSMGLFMELGPCITQPDGNSTKSNPYSWTEEANMIFIDQPIGVGFSHASGGLAVSTTEQAAIDVHAFLAIFFESFPDLKGRPFHLSGESYGGRYLPLFASEIVHQNERLVKRKSKRTPINLQSVLIGNGLTDIMSMATSYYDQACTATNGLGKPVLGVKTCITMQQEVQRCTTWLQKVCRTSLIQPECDIAQAYCGEKLQDPFIEGEINPYDISKPCTTLGEDLCYPETSVIKTYLDQSWVRKKLGVDGDVGSFESCSNKVGVAFWRAQDSMAPTFYHLTGLLEHGVRVLIYVGKLDWICNYIGNYRMLEALEWSGQEGFVAEELREWSTDKQASAGQTKSFGNLTYVDIRGAGHMVPLDKPKEALYMLKTWLAGGSF